MMEGFEKTGEKREVDSKFRQEIYSKAVRAGKRTYFFDVKSTRKDEYYLTITESKKRYDQDGNFHFEKHKIFLYKEDFDKFSEGLIEAIEILKKANNSVSEKQPDLVEEIASSSEIIEGLEVESFSQVEFEDLTE